MMLIGSQMKNGTAEPQLVSLLLYNSIYMRLLNEIRVSVTLYK